MEYDLRKFMEQCVEVYNDLVGTPDYLKIVATPFVNEDDRENPLGSLSVRGQSASALGVQQNLGRTRLRLQIEKLASL